jgi:hypothetical protein
LICQVDVVQPTTAADTTATSTSEADAGTAALASVVQAAAAAAAAVVATTATGTAAVTRSPSRSSKHRPHHRVDTATTAAGTAATSSSANTKHQQHQQQQQQQQLLTRRYSVDDFGVNMPISSHSSSGAAGGSGSNKAGAGVSGVSGGNRKRLGGHKSAATAKAPLSDDTAATDALWGLMHDQVHNSAACSAALCSIDHTILCCATLDVYHVDSGLEQYSCTAVHESRLM